MPGAALLKLVLILGAVMAGLGATVALPLGGDGEPAPTVVIVGDSLVFQSTDELALRMQDDFDHSLRGTPASTICDRKDDIADAVRRDPDALVIALGTNDVALGWDGEDFACLTDVVLNDTAEVDTIWVVPAYGAEQIRESLDHWADQTPRLTVAGWDEVTQVPDWYEPDGIHHNTEGQAQYAAFITNAVRDLVEP